MYAQRSNRRFHINPTSLGAAVAINAAVLAALFVAQPEWVPATLKSPVLETRNIPIPPEPLPIPEPTPVTDARIADPLPAPTPRPDVGAPVVDVSAPGPVFDIGALPPPKPPVGIGGTGTGTAPVEAPAPVMTGVGIDPRHADRFQPTYPAAERRDARNGEVVVRVLVGTDGRVKAVEQVSATSEAFFAATRRHALSNWRFTPATRDGVAIEAWHRMSVRFVMEN